MGRLYAVEIVYRGIFQKTLAKNLSRAIVLAAHREGKPGISFGRYGDSPERNGIPAKSFAIVATDDLTLEEGMAKYEPKEVDITIAVDDTLCKGVESWAWYGLAIVKAIPSFSGLWVYKDDHSDVRILGAISKVLPELFSITSLQEVIAAEWKDPVKATSALRAYERTETVTVEPSQGNPEKPYEFEFPKWQEMREGVTIPAIPMGRAVLDADTGKTGGYRPARNPTFKKYTTRSMRPVVDFEKCIKCTLCWLQCPDSCFDVMPDGMYDANMEACCGCGVCEAVCPEANCITMVSETQFRDNASQWDMWKKDKDGYARWVKEHIELHPERSHGFRYRGQYEAQVPEMLSIAREGSDAPAASDAPAQP